MRHHFVAMNMMNKCAKFHENSPSGKKVKFNLVRAIIYWTFGDGRFCVQLCIETLCKRTTSVAHLTNLSFVFFSVLFIEDASLLLLYNGTKSQDDQKLKSRGPSCLNFRFVSRDITFLLYFLFLITRVPDMYSSPFLVCPPPPSRLFNNFSYCLFPLTPSSNELNSNKIIFSPFSNMPATKSNLCAKRTSFWYKEFDLHHGWYCQVSVHKRMESGQPEKLCHDTKHSLWKEWNVEQHLRRLWT